MTYFLIVLLLLLGSGAFAAEEANGETPPTTTLPAERTAEKAANKENISSPRLPADLKFVKDIVFKQVGETKLDLLPDQRTRPAGNGEQLPASAADATDPWRPAR